MRDQNHESGSSGVAPTELDDVQKRLRERMTAAWAVFFFGVPAAFFGCAATFGTGFGFLLPVVVAAINLTVVVLWFKERARLPASERTVLPLVFMGGLALVLAAFALMALAISNLG